MTRRREPTVYDQLPGNPVRLVRRPRSDPAPPWPPPAGAEATIAVETPAVPSWWGDYVHVVVAESGATCRGRIVCSFPKAGEPAVGTELAFDARHVFQPGPGQPWFPTSINSHTGT